MDNHKITKARKRRDRRKKKPYNINIMNLPSEILLHIFHHIPEYAPVLLFVCKYFYNVINTSPKAFYCSWKVQNQHLCGKYPKNMHYYMASRAHFEEYLNTKYNPSEKIKVWKYILSNCNLTGLSIIEEFSVELRMNLMKQILVENRRESRHLIERFATQSHPDYSFPVISFEFILHYFSYASYNLPLDKYELKEYVNVVEWFYPKELLGHFDNCETFHIEMFCIDIRIDYKDVCKPKVDYDRVPETISRKEKKYNVQWYTTLNKIEKSFYKSD